VRRVRAAQHRFIVGALGVLAAFFIATHFAANALARAARIQSHTEAHMKKPHALKPIYAEEIATAMEMRTAGADDFTILRQTGVRPMDIEIAESMGIDVYPHRPQPVTEIS
jgi:hypothetical protein